MQQCPWSDYKGNLIYEGDIIVHPSGETGRIVLIDGACDEDRWRVDYGDEYMSRLCLQVGDKGQAVKSSIS